MSRMSSPPKCCVCSSQDVRFKYYLFDNEGLKWNKFVLIHECRQCKSFFSVILFDEMPYNSDYYVFAKYRKVADFAFARHCLNWLKERTGVAGRQLLDVGSGRGYFCDLAAHDGAEAIGLEPCRQVAEEAQCQGLNIIIDLFEAARLPANTFDLVTMWDVLEHFKEPAIGLSKAYDLLKKGGFLAVSVPSHSSVFAAIAGPYWRGYNTYHVSHFSIQGLTTLLQKKGFGIVSLETHDNNFFSREGFYRLGIKDRIKANLIRIQIGKQLIVSRRRKRVGNREIITGHNEYVQGSERNIFVKLSKRLIGRLKRGDQIRVLAKKV